MAADNNKLYQEFIFELFKWDSLKNNKSLEESVRENDFSKLKVLKLFFLMCSKSESFFSDYEFDFKAMQYGPVEWGLYNNLENEVFVTNSYKTKLLNFDQKLLEQESTPSLNKALGGLMEENSSLINYSAFRLVDLTHLWDSWRLNFEIGERNSITLDEIINDPNQVYSY